MIRRTYAHARENTVSAGHELRVLGAASTSVRRQSEFLLAIRAAGGNSFNASVYPVGKQYEKERQVEKQHQHQQQNCLHGGNEYTDGDCQKDTEQHDTEIENHHKEMPERREELAENIAETFDEFEEVIAYAFPRFCYRVAAAFENTDDDGKEFFISLPEKIINESRLSFHNSSLYNPENREDQRYYHDDNGRYRDQYG